MRGESTLVVPPDHPALPGHFPGAPVVPGVLVLAHVLAALERAAGPLRLTAIPEAKFLGPLGPGEACAIEFPAAAAGEARFACRAGSRVIARGTLRFRTDDLDAR
jgi:3-hydroxymyristoyl/3-hydroxydecanoyl-(acyl carrier protein) dehydratase